MFELFFQKLAIRLKSENNLSDITWAMTRVSQKFSTAFIQFFFSDQIPVEDSESIFIERERALDTSRPDFYFSYDDKHFLIENKIYDRSQHFDDYVRVFNIPNSQLGYITNYPLHEEGFVVHTWREFYNYLAKLIPEDESEIWNAYLSYVQKCCNLNISTEPMQIDPIYTLFTFYHSIDQIASQDCELFHTCVEENAFNRGWFYNRAGGNFQGGPKEGIMGKYFQVSFKNSNIKDTYGWFGIYFCHEEPEICIAFFNYEDCGWPVYQRLWPLYVNNQMPEGELCSDPFRDEAEDAITSPDAFFFDFLPPADFKDMSPDNQNEILRQFFSEALTKIALSPDLTAGNENVGDAPLSSSDCAEESE